MALEIGAAQMADAERLGTICFEAFRQEQERHGLLPDWPSPAVAQQALALLIADPHVVAVKATVDGVPAGSYFLSHHDGWGGIGPVSVDPAHQGQGIGRALMAAVIGAADGRGMSHLRLQQDAANLASLALYASLGFTFQEATVVMEAQPFLSHGAAGPGVRPATSADLDAIDRLSQRHLQISRRHEVAAALAHGFVTLVSEDGDGLGGYFIAGRRGHGVAVNEETMLALIDAAAQRLAPAPVRFLCPLREAALFRHLLAADSRAGKVMTLLTRGEYATPKPVWLPSVLG